MLLLKLNKMSYVKEILKKRDRNEEREQKLISDHRTKRQKTENDMNEKIAIAEQTLTLVESFLKKLDADLGGFELALRGGGEFEVVGAEPGQEVDMDEYVTFHHSSCCTDRRLIICVALQY